MAIIRSGVKLVQFAVLGAGGGGGGRLNGSYAHTDHGCGNGGCGSLVTAAYFIPDGTTLYRWVGKAGQGGRQTAADSNHNTYGGNGAGVAGTGTPNDSGGEGGEFSAIFTGNGVTNTNALIVAGGGGGAAGRPHSATSPAQRCNGGGGVNNKTWGAGNDGTKGQNTATLSGTRDGSSEGGQKNAGGRAGTAGGTSRNTATAGTNWTGGNGSRSAAWGAGGGGGGGLYGGGGGADDGNAWGGQGGGAGSSYIRGFKDSDYSDANLNSMPTGYQCVHANFWLLDWGHRGGTQISGGAGSGNLVYNMRDPIDIVMYTGQVSGKPSAIRGAGGKHTTSYPGEGDDGYQGMIAYRKLSSNIIDLNGPMNWFDTSTCTTGWTQLTNTVGGLSSFTV